MDSISQALWGALSSEATQKEKKGNIPAWFIGILAGTAPDLDTFIKSSTDPLIATVFHRHFTHSIFFVPLGAFLVWLLLFYFFRKEKELYFNYYKICFFGYGTHWILDVLTAYGTQIFWPLTNHRYAFDWLSIVDPFLTLPWLIFLLLFIFLKKRRLIHMALVYTFAYMIFCGLQHHRAEKSLKEKLISRGHESSKYRLLPSLGNSFWFRSIYAHDDQIFADGVLIVPRSKQTYWRQGSSVKRMTSFEIESLLSKELSDEEKIQFQKQISIWSWFTDDFMYLSKTNENEAAIGDGRYSIDVSGFNSLWSLALDRNDAAKTQKTSPQVFDDSGNSRSPFEGFQLLLNPDLVD